MYTRLGAFSRLSGTHRLLAVTFAILVAGLAACGGGDDDDSSAWIRIDAPVDGASTGADTVTVEGNAALDEAAYVVGPVYWYNDGASGVLPHQNVCILGCLAAFRGDVPLFLGSNTISVQLGNVSDSVTITRYPQVVATGTVVMNDAATSPVAGVTITLSGDQASTTQSDAAGAYLFEFLRDGRYSVNASLTPPQLVGCLEFAPHSREFVVAADEYDDIRGLDFTAQQLAPCFRISGQITASTNPDFGQPDIQVALTDSDGIEYVVYSGISGYYDFWHLPPGTYTVTPTQCSFGCATFIPAEASVTITDSDVFSVDFVRVFD